MKKLFLSLIEIIGLINFISAQQTSIEALRSMHSKYSSKWCQTITSSETSERYYKDSLINVDTFYNSASFPNKFRVDYGSISKGNATMILSDSIYSFRHGKFVNVHTDQEDPVLLLLGRMFFLPFDSVTAKLKDFLGLDMDKFHEENWNGKAVYMIGSNNKDEKVNQIWIEKERLIPLMILEYGEGLKIQGWFNDYVQLGGGWMATKFTLFSNDKLIHKDTYYNYKANPALDDRLFTPTKFGEWHWLKKE